MSDTASLALWAANLAVPIDGLDDWAARVEARMAAARAAGADILVLPEYAAEQWLHFAGALEPDEEVPWLAAQAPGALARLRPLPRRHGLALLAGTMPVAAEAPAPGEAPYRNRAHLLLPDGRTIAQDKLCLTPGERNPEAWHLAPGRRVEIVAWRGLRLTVLICLDIELPGLAARLAGADLDLVLVPSMTAQLSGYARVSACARARAVELQAAVCVAACAGQGGPSKLRGRNTGGAAVYLPCEAALGHTGVFAETAPCAEPAGEGAMLVARDVPVAALRALRRGTAEVWPGAWDADSVEIVEPRAAEAASG